MRGFCWPFDCSLTPFAGHHRGFVFPPLSHASSADRPCAEVNNGENGSLMSVHSAPGCTRNDAIPMKGGKIGGNCDVRSPSRFRRQNFADPSRSQATDQDWMGCSVRDTSTRSYGAGFAEDKGSVYAMQLTKAGCVPALLTLSATTPADAIAHSVFIWRWPRNAVPADVTAGAPVPSSWGTPMAAWGAATCDPVKYFKDLSIVMCVPLSLSLPARLEADEGSSNITTCGDWAGGEWVWQQSTCSQKYAACSVAVADPANFAKAYVVVVREGERALIVLCVSQVVRDQLGQGLQHLEICNALFS